MKKIFLQIWDAREQQSVERGFSFLKDPMFLTDSVFLKSAKRIEALGLIMGLCLLVYTLGQRQLRQTLKRMKTGVKNQLGRLTDRPTLRWIFQCFQLVHVFFIEGVKQVSNREHVSFVTHTSNAVVNCPFSIVNT